MGVKGMSMRSIPKGRKADIIALAKAGKEPVHPDSPTPLAPSKFKEVCTSTVSLRMMGMPPALGKA